MNTDRRIQIIIWFAILMSVVIYAVVINFSKVEPKEVEFNTDIFLFLGGIFALIPYVMKYLKILKLLIPFGVIIAEIPAIIGLVVYFAFSDKNLAYRLIAISFASILFLFPGKIKSTEKSKDLQNPPPIE